MGFSALPYVFASLGMMGWAFWVDRSGKKIFNLAVTCFLGALGLIASVVFKDLWPALAGLTFALVGVTAARAVFWTIPTRFLTGVAAAGGLAFINSVGTIGGFVRPYMMGELRQVTGSYETGLLAMAGFMVVATLLAASLKLIVTRE